MKQNDNSKKNKRKYFIQELREKNSANSPKQDFAQEHYKIVMKEQRLTAKTQQPEDIKYTVKKHSSIPTLEDTLANYSLDIAESCALSQALLKTYDDQISSKNQNHNALEASTILVDRADPMAPQVTLVDLGSVKPEDNATENSDYQALMAILREIWQKASPHTTKLSAECQEKFDEFEIACDELFNKSATIRP